MKNYLSFYLSLAALLYVAGTTYQAKAQYVVDCVNCSTWFTQIPQYAEDLINTSANSISSVNSIADDLNKYVLDPLANNMLAAVQIQKQLQTVNFITAAFGNEGSLLIQNPEQWIKNKGYSQVKIALGGIQQENGLYKDSLLASIIETYKSADDLTSTIHDLSSSNVPNAIQKNICNDSSLTNLAKNDVMLSDGSYDMALLQRRKGELYTTLCTANPLTNAELARTLSMINQQMPSIGGWDTWLLMTGGDNQYAQASRMNLAIAKKVSETEQAKRDELNRNGGIANKTDCLERGYPINDDEGNPLPGVGDTSLPCAVEEITQTGNALNSQYLEALNAPMRKLQASFGTGIYKSLGSIMSIIGSMRELSTAFGDGSGYSGTYSSSSVAVTYATDLTDPVRQAQTVDNVRDPLNRHLQALSQLESTENNFLAALSSYEGQINGLKQCYAAVETDIRTTYPDDTAKLASFQSDYRVTGANAYADGKLSIIQSQRATSNSNLSKIADTRTLINNTIASSTASQSTQEITDLFTSYQKAVTARSLPDYSVAPQRQADMVRFQADIQADAMQGGPFTTHTTNCSTVRSQYLMSYDSAP